MSHTNTFSRLIVWGVSSCLILTSVSFAPSSFIAANADTRAEYETRASQFDSAIRELERILTMNLATESGASQANAIVTKNMPFINYGTSKGVSIGLQQRAFLEGLKARAGKQRSAFLKAISSDPTSIMRTPGADDAATAIRQSLMASAARLTKVSQVLRTASAAGQKAQNQHLFPDNSMVATRTKQTAKGPLSHHIANGPSQANGDEMLRSSIENNLAPQGETIVVASGGSAVVLILVIVAFKYIEYQVEERVATGALERCLKEAEDNYKSCLSKTGGNPFAIMGCTAVCIATKAVCYAGIG